MNAMTSAAIAAGLRQLGLAEGDIVLLHSSLASVGLVEGGAAAVVQAFLDVLGGKGTLLAPTFEPGLGLIAEAIAKHPQAVQSIHPLACVAAIGAQAQELCRDHWKAETAHAEGTPYLRVAERGGYVCLLGVDQDRNTTLHTAEALLKLPYLTTETRTFQTPEGTVTRSWNFFPGPHRDFIGLDPMLRASGKMKIGYIGNAMVRLIKSSDLIDLAVAAGSRNPAFVLCDNPNCPDCVAQKAAIRKALFASEKFSVAASAQLAGEFPDEIAARCREAGITAVELDGLQGRPLTMLPAEVVADAVARLRAANLRVTALRCPAASNKAADLIKLASTLHVRRFVMPLSERAPHFAALARDHEIAISFFNTDLDSDACSEILLGLQAQKLSAGFTFNGPGFARCGELPFLASYKKKLRRFVDQLDVADATYDGTPRLLATGNAEIKEMISILRCASFAGTMCLRSERRLTTLPAAAESFAALLRQM
ncbi:MAG TPA: AAC(3) family N-acetyltransferase [Clostridia bacterium]|nr:AAC(3) family N-acetyltransferase [Clostridia bacterium]